jgi:FkbM family methyltransferase
VFSVAADTLFGRVLRAPLSLLPKTAAVPILRGPLRGQRWIVGSATHGCWLGTYELAKQRAFAEAVRPGQVVFDLGANVGFYTLIAAARSGSTGRVYAFEPLPRNVAFLRQHLHYKPSDAADVEVIEAAVSDIEGTAAFQESPSPAMGRLMETGGLQVKTVTLDEMVLDRGLPAPDVIKIDVEGGEKRVLDGAIKTLGRAHPVIFLATHGSRAHAECCSLLRTLGYGLSGIDGKDVADTDELVARFPAARA